MRQIGWSKGGFMADVIFETERLVVRPWTSADRTAILDLLSDPITMAHWERPLDAAGADVWLEWALADMQRVGYARWCVQQISDGQIVGDVGIRRKEMFGEMVNDLGYIIDHRFWHRGYGYEAAAGAVEWARANGLADVVANMATDNVASVAMAEKLGMIREREFANPTNRNKSTFWYRLVFPDQPSPVR